MDKEDPRMAFAVAGLKLCGPFDVLGIAANFYFYIIFKDQKDLQMQIIAGVTDLLEGRK